MATIGINCLIEGHVQRVFFRATTREKTIEPGLHGRVRNLPNGSVEVVACGKQRQLQILQKWLWHGSPAAQVHNVHNAHQDRGKPSTTCVFLSGRHGIPSFFQLISQSLR